MGTQNTIWTPAPVEQSTHNLIDVQDFFIKLDIENCTQNYDTQKTLRVTMGILHKKVIDFNSIFSSVAIPKILIKYLLHASHDS